MGSGGCVLGCLFYTGAVGKKILSDWSPSSNSRLIDEMMNI